MSARVTVRMSLASYPFMEFVTMFQPLGKTDMLVDRILKSDWYVPVTGLVD